MNLFGGQQRKSLVQIHPQLRPKQAQRTRTGPVVLADTALDDLLQELMVYFHKGLWKGPEAMDTTNFWSK